MPRTRSTGLKSALAALSLTALSACNGAAPDSLLGEWNCRSESSDHNNALTLMHTDSFLNGSWIFLGDGNFRFDGNFGIVVLDDERRRTSYNADVSLIGLWKRENDIVTTNAQEIKFEDLRIDNQTPDDDGTAAFERRLLKPIIRGQDRQMIKRLNTKTSFLTGRVRNSLGEELSGWASSCQRPGAVAEKSTKAYISRWNDMKIEMIGAL